MADLFSYVSEHAGATWGVLAAAFAAWIWRLAHRLPILLLRIATELDHEADELERIDRAASAIVRAISRAVRFAASRELPKRQQAAAMRGPHDEENTAPKQPPRGPLEPPGPQ